MLCCEEGINASAVLPKMHKDHRSIESLSELHEAEAIHQAFMEASCRLEHGEAVLIVLQIVQQHFEPCSRIQIPLAQASVGCLW